MKKIRVYTTVLVRAWVEQEAEIDVYIEEGTEPFIDSFEFVEWNHPMTPAPIDTDTMNNYVDVMDAHKQIWAAIDENDLLKEASEC